MKHETNLQLNGGAWKAPGFDLEPDARAFQQLGVLEADGEVWLVGNDAAARRSRWLG